MLSLTIILFYLQLQYFHPNYNKNKFSTNTNKYICLKVVKIDRIRPNSIHANKDSRGAFIIHAVLNGKTVRIASEITPYNSKPCICVGKCYAFSIKNYFAQDPRFPADLELAQSNGILVGGVYIKREEDFFTDIYYDENLDGLCFKKNID